MTDFSKKSFGCSINRQKGVRDEDRSIASRQETNNPGENKCWLQPGASGGGRRHGQILAGDVLHMRVRVKVDGEVLSLNSWKDGED